MNKLPNVLPIKIFLTLLCLFISFGFTAPESQADIQAGPQPSIESVLENKGMLPGYLPREIWLNNPAFIPPPPIEGSTALALDQDISQNSLSLQGSPRWELAAQDANLQFPQATESFSCALDVPITVHDTPHIYRLMRRTMADTQNSTSKVKAYYQRVRPFLVNQEPVCTPNQKESLSQQWSYPSGHTAIGWAWALILSEIASERSDAILARGRTFGQSRVVCNVHWHSDVVEGRTIGAAVVAQLHSNSEFLADLNMAKAEWSLIKDKSPKPARNCKAEAIALATHPSLADGSDKTNSDRD